MGHSFSVIGLGGDAATIDTTSHEHQPSGSRSLWSRMTGSAGRWCWVVLVSVLALLRPGSVAAQATKPSVPVIRNVVIDRAEVFDSAETKQFWGFALVNALH